MNSPQALPNEVRSFLERLSDVNLQKIAVLFSGQPEMSQLNLGGAKGFQVKVSGDTAYIGDQYHVDATTLEKALEKLLRRRQLPSAIGIPQNLPCSGVVEFVGRDQKLTELHTIFQQNERIAITAIAGMGGIGKTELACQYAMAQLKQGQYPGSLCWLSARDQEIATQIVSFAKTKLLMTIPDDFEVREQVERIWRLWPEGDVLIVIDDVTGYKAIQPYLPPADPRFKLLITTRLDLGRSVKKLDIEELDEESSIKLLEVLVEDSLRIQGQLEDAKTLCKWVGYLPLALELLGRFLWRKPDWKIAKLLNALKGKSLDATALTAPESGMTAQLGVAAALELSWQELNEAEQKLAYVVGMFAVAPIPWALVEQCLPDIDPEELEEIRDDGLIARSLVKRVGEARYQLHQIVQEYFRLKLKQDSDQNQEIKKSFCRAMVEVAQSINYTPTLAEIERVRGAIVHLEEVASRWSEDIKLDDLISCFQGIGQFYKGQGNYSFAEPWYSKCPDMTRKLLGNNHPDIATSLNNLALLYQSQGRYKEAEPLFIKALQFTKKLLGNNHPDVATSLNNLALLYQSQGWYKEAETLFINALQLTRKLLGNDHPDVATSLNNLALLYQSQGRYQEAEPLFIDALQLRQKLLGNDHPDVATSLNNLALLYYFQGRYQEAEPLFIDALQLYKKLLGNDHPDVARSLNNLATFYRSQGRYQEAEPLFIKALQLYKKLLGNDHPDVATGLNNLAAFYQSQGRYQEAEPLFIKALQLYKKLLGNDHPDVATSLNNLAAFYQFQGRYQEAEPLFIDALQLRQKLLGNDHPDVATSLNNLALLYQSQGRYQEAEPLFINTLQLYKKLLGNDHPDVATSLNNLALLYQSQGRYQEAEPLFINTLQLTRKLLGNDHPDAAITPWNLGVLYQKQQRYTEAEALYRQALAIAEATLGPNHPHTQDIRDSLKSLPEHT